MAFDQSLYYRQRVEQLRREIAGQKETVGQMQQRLSMLEAELSAFEAALVREVGQEESGPKPSPEAVHNIDTYIATPEDHERADSVMSRSLLNNSPTLTGVLAEMNPPSYAEVLRIILGESSGGMTPSDLLTAFEGRGQAIKREYLYALLSRLRSRGELKRRAKKYSLNEARVAR